ncbi:hypothetical protein [Ekhidna sp.]|uniref:hypothetical protein n=1 Tax=Ekhidna sp. TaxID=2608089 RepID=UPI003296856A
MTSATKYIGKIIVPIILPLLVGIMGLFSCQEHEGIQQTSNMDVLLPGDIIPLNKKVCIKSSGIYKLTSDASLLTTRCYGSISFSFELPDSTGQMNSCNSPLGQTTQTNNISGISEVYYSIQSEAYAEILLQ